MCKNLKKTEISSVNGSWSFGDEIVVFVKNMEALTDMFPLLMELVGVKMVRESKCVERYLKDNGIVEEEGGSGDGKNRLSIPADKIKSFISLNDKVEITKIAFDLLPVNIVVSFISQYDAYLGKIIRLMFLVKPELLNNSEKNVLFSEFMSFSSIDEAKDYLIEKEVESVIRESHLKQFEWLEKKLKIELRKDLPSFNSFIEISERRNLFVHCNGFVSRQYLKSCMGKGLDYVDGVGLGDVLSVSPEYFYRCYFVLLEIGIKLGQVVWRKVEPENIEKADYYLNNICYQLLLKKHYKLALNILSFATDVLKKHHDYKIICYFTVNKALAYYLSDKKEECNKVLDQHDWSATSDIFRLAVCVLKEKYDEALELMKIIGNTNKEIDKDAYRDWPLFTDFRKYSGFEGLYREIFGEDIVYFEEKPQRLEDILIEIKSMKKEMEVEL